MKKTSISLAAVLILCMSVLSVGCSSSDGSSSDSAGSSPSVSAPTGAVTDGYEVTLKGVEIQMCADAAAVVEELGEEKSYFESESCAFEGLDKVYTYSGFKLNTYPVGDQDYVLSVVFSDDTVETDEGIMIGSSKDEVLDAYGDPQEETDTSLIYEKNGTTLTIGLDGDSVRTIEISADVED